MELEDVPNTKGRVLSLGVASLIAITVVLAGIVFFAKSRVDQSRKPVSIPTPSASGSNITPRESLLNGKLGLALKGSTGSYKKGDSVIVFVYGDAKDVKTTGYDALLRYDPQKLRYERLSSSLDGMDVFETDALVSDGMRELLITGVRSTARKEPFLLVNTALVEVTFTVLGSGPTRIALGYEPGSSKDSNMMNDQNQDVLGSVEDLDISIR
ncbi:hypothetical protein A3I56_00555 [Candidatus Roizmanbacteria bacterium RIFCSPLOWO2_02_FULL_43_10]|uniref:Cohesin domain-containing protein n=1 Tax=Candidatus Roizmanbacteria bacterium RIFCSPLOWO2_02_FULL_43_10 TaxID=1802078 RepID=A0A1F7K231_9BACT|nr:MAG: hypothetical protein A3I56_00555 [Candidatus Roizmanbacteria bacterium RIFCSPLOWO2_02_FULL_43_10]